MVVIEVYRVKYKQSKYGLSLDFEYLLLFCRNLEPSSIYICTVFNSPTLVDLFYSQELINTEEFSSNRDDFYTEIS